MTSAEIKMIVAKEALAEARKEHDAAVSELLIAKKKGIYTDDYHRRELEARYALLAAESMLRKAKETIDLENAISDEQADKLGEYFAGNPSGWEADGGESSEEDDALVDAIVAGLD